MPATGIVETGERVVFLQLLWTNIGSYESDLLKHERHI